MRLNRIMLDSEFSVGQRVQCFFLLDAAGNSKIILSKKLQWANLDRKRKNTGPKTSRMKILLGYFFELN